MLELPAPQAGVLVELTVAVGDTVTSQQVIGRSTPPPAPPKLRCCRRRGVPRRCCPVPPPLKPRHAGRQRNWPLKPAWIWLAWRALAAMAAC